MRMPAMETAYKPSSAGASFETAWPHGVIPNVRSMFGSQPLSSRQTAPSFGFGTASRERVSKVYITGDHCRINYGTCSPGPVYNLNGAIDKKRDTGLSVSGKSAICYFGGSSRFPQIRSKTPTTSLESVPGPGKYNTTSSIGSQLESTKGSSAMHGFGTATRNAQQRVYLSRDHDKSNAGSASPGPGRYAVPSSIGRQPHSKKDSAPSWVFGSGGRFQYDYERRASTVPGAGAYSISSSLGSQKLSKQQSSPAFGFGVCNRESANKVYLSPEHEKSSYGFDSPGPASQPILSSFGGQHLSKLKSSGQFKFGTEGRFRYQQSTVPGPGAY